MSIRFLIPLLLAILVATSPRLCAQVDRPDPTEVPLYHAPEPVDPERDLTPLLQAAEGDCILVVQGKEPPTILLGQEDPVLRFAANELRRYIEKMTTVLPTVELSDGGSPSCSITIVSFRGESPDDAAKPANSAELPEEGTDQYAIQVMKDCVKIHGGSPRAALFGSYDLLEQLGCRWFGPLEEHVPQTPVLAISPAVRNEQPSFEWRILEFIAGSDPACVDWMAKLRMNGAWPEKYTPNEDMTVHSASMEATGVPAMVERGLSIFWGGHILPQLLSPTTYADHPEYFALVNGKRLDSTVDFQTMAQPCTSNDEAMKVLTENTIAFLENHDWIEVLFIWGNDTNVWCECEGCRALEKQPDRESSFGGLDRSASYCRMIKIINEGSLPGMSVQFDGVQKALPGRKIGFNHYYNLEDLPLDAEGNVRTEVLPENSSIISAVDAYRQCDRHTFADPNCPRGKRVEPIAHMWSPYYPHSVSWSYYWSWNFMKGLPVGMTHKIANDFRFLHSLGVNGVVDNVSLVPSTLDRYDLRPAICMTDHWRYNIMNFYTYAKAAWDIDLDVDASNRDFIAHYYGPAAEPMGHFWTHLEDAWTGFGQKPEFMPENEELNDPRKIHSWVQNLHYVIPNRDVFNVLVDDLERARYLAASAYSQPLKAEFMPYLERVQLLERALSVWPSTSPTASYMHD